MERKERENLIPGKAAPEEAEGLQTGEAGAFPAGEAEGLQAEETEGLRAGEAGAGGQGSYVPASPVKRLWAWVGVVYMVILVLANVYALATAAYLTGIGPLAAAPALCGLGGTVILRYRQGQGRGGLAACVGLSGACFALAAWGLLRGLPALLAQL